MPIKGILRLRLRMTREVSSFWQEQCNVKSKFQGFVPSSRAEKNRGGLVAGWIKSKTKSKGIVPRLRGFAATLGMTVCRVRAKSPGYSGNLVFRALCCGTLAPLKT